MNGLADTTATYDSGTNRMTVISPNDTICFINKSKHIKCDKKFVYNDRF